jgi:peptide/nickel transport system permease protein
LGVYVVRRLLIAVLTVLTVSFAAFVGFALSFDPSYPLAIGGQHAGAHAFVQAYYHLNDPILSRYWRWLTGVFQHGFGRTVSIDVEGTVPPRFRSLGTPIGPQLWRASAVTAQLVGAALVLVILGSAVVGTISAQRRRFRLDVSTRFLAYMAAAVPTFLIGDLMRRAIVPHETFVKTGGTIHAVNVGGGWLELGPPTGGLVDWVRHMTLPAVALAIGLIGIYSRHLRSSMLVALGEPYVLVARAKGLPERRVVIRHALRNSLIPFTSLLSLEIGGVIGASIAADAVFTTGGLASTFLATLNQGDPFELTALFVVAAIVVCVFTFVGDAVVGVLDPRTRTS